MIKSKTHVLLKVYSHPLWSSHKFSITVWLSQLVKDNVCTCRQLHWIKRKKERHTFKSFKTEWKCLHFFQVQNLSCVILISLFCFNVPCCYSFACSHYAHNDGPPAVVVISAGVLLRKNKALAPSFLNSLDSRKQER